MLAAIEKLLQEMYKLDHQLKENLSQARARMKHYADKKMIERSFDEGDWVFLKLHPYVQHSVEFRRNRNHVLGTLVSIKLLKR